MATEENAANGRPSILHDERSVCDSLFSEGNVDQREECLSHRDDGRESPVCSRTILRIENLITCETLGALELAFVKRDHDPMSLDEFVGALGRAINKTIPAEQLSSIFTKINVSNDNQVSWDELATYMMMELKEKDDSYIRERKVSVQVPATRIDTPHDRAIVRIRPNSKKQYITLSSNGLLVFWLPTKRMAPTVREVQLDLNSNCCKAHKTWSTDFALLPEFQKLAVASGDREIWFLDIASLEPLFVITHLDHPVLRMDIFFDSEQQASVLLFCDESGCIIALTFPKETYQSAQFRAVNKAFAMEPGRININDLYQPSTHTHQAVVTASRWHVHHDWVL